MRDIKFRAWVYEETKQRKDMPKATYDTFTISELMSGRYSFQEYDKWEQFTGLKDKNGKEIYEGDILKDIYTYSPEMSFNMYDKERIIEVKLPDFYMNWPEYLIGTFEGLQEYFNESEGKYGIEVIGNIYENPELLEVS